MSRYILLTILVRPSDWSWERQSPPAGAGAGALRSMPPAAAGSAPWVGLQLPPPPPSMAPLLLLLLRLQFARVWSSWRRRPQDGASERASERGRLESESRLASEEKKPRGWTDLVFISHLPPCTYIILRLRFLSPCIR